MGGTKTRGKITEIIILILNSKVIKSKPSSVAHGIRSRIRSLGPSSTAPSPAPLLFRT